MPIWLGFRRICRGEGLTMGLTSIFFLLVNISVNCCLQIGQLDCFWIKKEKYFRPTNDTSGAEFMLTRTYASLSYYEWYIKSSVNANRTYFDLLNFLWSWFVHLIKNIYISSLFYIYILLWLFFQIIQT